MNTSESALKLMLDALVDAGFSRARIVRGSRTVIAKQFNGYIVSVDLMVDPERVAKICLFGRSNVRTHFETFLSIGRAIGDVDLGQLYVVGTRRTGVIFKINTHVNWENATKDDFVEIAKKVKEFAKKVQGIVGT